MGDNLLKNIIITAVTIKPVPIRIQATVSSPPSIIPASDMPTTPDIDPKNIYMSICFICVLGIIKFVIFIVTVTPLRLIKISQKAGEAVVTNSFGWPSCPTRTFPLYSSRVSELNPRPYIVYAVLE